MPEGDTVWLTAHRLNRALAGRPLTVADLRVPALATVDLVGRQVSEVLARGKHLLVRFDGGLTLHSHLRMDGSWYLNRAGERPRGHPDHMIRAQLGNIDWLATGYRVHDLELVATAQESQLVGHLGPDLLGPDWDLAEAVRRVNANPEQSIADALLDQRNLAGIGNLYKSEVLFIERVNPHRLVADIEDVASIINTAHRLLNLNRDRPEQATTGMLGRGQQHWVYERGGRPCLRCGTAIKRELQGEPGRERSTYWCPSCQPA